MSEPRKAGAHRVKIEFIQLGILFLCGLLLVPLAIFLVGSSIFGGYAGGNFLDFLTAYLRRLAAADLATWFLLFAPYLIWQSLRATVAAFRWRKRPAKNPDKVRNPM
ncbi:MAG: hypothetical protein HKP32_05090 [Woeseia sp.]|nr:hypothetical protein [Woeseia sp.]MBT8096328.1 hypothetical protein [Woeseia sp.]NNL54507.1 hypothetical protein [Woeseia sp.]